MRRRLATLVCLAAGLLAIFIVLGWARSLWRFDLVSYRHVAVDLNRGWSIQLAYSASDGSNRLSVQWAAYHDASDARSTRQSQSGGRWVTLPSPGSGAMGTRPGGSASSRIGIEAQFADTSLPRGHLKQGVLVAPHWLLLALVAPVILVCCRRQWRESTRRRRRERGLCETCGYDLRDSGDACPECGREIANPAPID